VSFVLILAAFVGFSKSEIDELLAGRRRSLLPHPWLLAYGLVAFAFATMAQWIEMSWGR
jgi:predicted DNA-binding transcriptional regulator AlpA